MKNSNFVICSFYTKDTVYEQIIKQYLVPSIVKWGLQSSIIDIDNEGNWKRNVAKKPTIISELLHDFPNKTIVFLDADCTIEQYPTLFDNVKDYDIGFHRLDWNSWYKNNSNKKELLTGTMFLNANYRTHELVNEWKNQSLLKDMWEQKVLEDILPTFRHELKILELPLNYCYIDTLPNGSKPHVPCDDVVIRHYQASRKTKKAL